MQLEVRTKMANKKLPKDVSLGLKIERLEKRFMEGKPNTRENRNLAYQYATNKLSSPVKRKK